MEFDDEIYNELADEFGPSALASNDKRKYMSVAQAQYLVHKYKLNRTLGYKIAARYNDWLQRKWN